LNADSFFNLKFYFLVFGKSPIIAGLPNTRKWIYKSGSSRPSAVRQLMETRILCCFQMRVTCYQQMISRTNSCDRTKARRLQRRPNSNAEL